MQVVSAAAAVPPCFVALLALGVLSTACMGLARVRMSPTWVEDLHSLPYWRGALGLHQDGGFKHMLAPIYGIEARRRAAFRDEKVELDVEMERLRGDKDRLLREQKKARGDERHLCEGELLQIERRISDIQMVASPRMVVRDATPEALVREMGRQGGRLSWVHPEGGQVINLCTKSYLKNGDSKLAALCQAYSSEAITVARITRDEVDVPHPMLTMLLAAQPHVLRDILGNRELEDIGFVGRLIVAVPPSIVGKRPLSTGEVPEAVRRGYEERITTLVERGRTDPDEMPVLTLSVDAAALFQEARDRLEREIGDGGRLSSCPSWGAKMQGRLGRLAGLFHLAAGMSVEEPISEATMRNAVGVSDWACEHFEAAWLMADPRGEDARTRKAWLFILRALEERGERDADGTLFVPGARCQDSQGTFKRKGALTITSTSSSSAATSCERRQTWAASQAAPVLLKANPEVLP